MAQQLQQTNSALHTAPQVKKKARTKWTRDDFELGLLGFPTFIWYAIFCYLPMFGLVIAFKNYRVFPKQSFLYNLFHSEWVGFDNFSFFINNKSFSMLMRNTILYNLVFIVLSIVLPIALALMINEIYSKRKSKVYQTAMFFPHFMSWVVVSYFVFGFLNPDRGLLNTIVKFFGGSKVMWYSKAQYWPFILVFMQVWKSLGYNMVVYLASITGMDQSLYEAAMLDGASKWQQAKYITLPLLKTIVIVLFLLNVGRIFYSDFGLFYQVTQGVPNSLHKVASTFDTYIYMALQSNSPIGKTAAASMFQSVACCITVLLANFIVSKVDPESAII
ncbi:MAG: sugar ABC transporter permease [Clostridiales bacterium]|nr:sugar ABC transporter permease [Clostridiales bacterium]